MVTCRARLGLRDPAHMKQVVLKIKISHENAMNLCPSTWLLSLFAQFKITYLL